MSLPCRVQIGQGHAERSFPMEKMTRRGLIKRATIGVGAAGVVVAAAATGAHFAPVASNTSASDKKQSAITATDPIVVWIGNPANGTVVMMRGESQVVINNPAFVQSVLSL